ncbi:Uma2 family endonuclease [Romeria aff. gracilis LEGE 07310]|uniref:Uma2 family endonuclease n=1 Tax=Vasconcelosia minhoensis LEGE 07310 TaxID=915328 RepID=A0A8J7ARA3_9CYAN|nr:Uma2 family endonuclease [Romeria gracilis]MBE9079149.1 Uma2 family endonuclease [Romeria aff. gracilis LEGE 07310]
MAIASSPTEIYTAEEYLALEVESDLRSEYRNGAIVPMTGGTPEHNRITSALNALLWFGLRGKPYSIFITDQRLWIPAVDRYTYPDVMAIANPVELKPGRKDTVTNPVLIAEVLSDSTRAYDRGDKFEAYRTIPTFQEYLLIDPYRLHIEQFVKQSNNQWLFTEYSGLDDRISLSSLPAEISLRDLYEGVLEADGELEQ